ncbi:ribosome silencing factor [Helicobacter winghamensis]|nr:ribosome silencing factor [Helicobacter winghamensis]
MDSTRDFGICNKGSKLQERKALVQEICQILEDKKAEDIEVFNLIGTDYFVDFVVITTALIDRHALALLDALKKPLKEKGESFYHIDDENPDWIVADLGDIIVHIFTENQRKKFNLEEFLQKLLKEKESVNV